MKNSSCRNKLFELEYFNPRALSFRCSVFVLSAIAVSAVADGPVSPLPPSLALSIDLEASIVAGNGCQNAAALRALSATELIFALPNMAISLPEYTVDVSDRKRCTIVLPYQIQKGLKLKSVSLDTHIYLFKATNARAAFAFGGAAGGPMDISTLDFRPGRFELIRNREWKATLDFARAKCGGDGIINLSLVMSGQRQDDEEYSKLGLADQSDVKLAFELEPCSGV